MTSLLDLRARQYDAATGRFLSGDPSPAGQTNPFESSYAYAGDDPIDNVDLDGNIKKPKLETILTIFDLIAHVGPKPKPDLGEKPKAPLVQPDSRPKPEPPKGIVTPTLGDGDKGKDGEGKGQEGNGDESGGDNEGSKPDSGASKSRYLGLAMGGPTLNTHPLFLPPYATVVPIPRPVAFPGLVLHAGHLRP